LGEQELAIATQEAARKATQVVDDKERSTLERDAALSVLDGPDNLVIVHSLYCLAISPNDLANVLLRLVAGLPSVVILEAGLPDQGQGYRTWRISRDGASDTLLRMLVEFWHQKSMMGIRKANKVKGDLSSGTGPVPSVPDPASIPAMAELWLTPGGMSLRDIGAKFGRPHKSLDRHMQNIFGCQRHEAQDKVASGEWNIRDCLAKAGEWATNPVRRRVKPTLEQPSANA
jgi:hypothetical protein